MTKNTVNNPFRPGFHQLSIILTDLVEAEALIQKMARKEAKASPSDFSGKTPCVYFKMPYVPPCESFKELRHLILRVFENTGLRANFKGIVSIEATEWLGHEQEEYFSVVLKYLYDHRDIWRPAMILNNCSETQLRRFLSACVKYITPQVYDGRIFTNRQTLETLLEEALLDRQYTLSKKAKVLLTEALSRPELAASRSLTLIERVAEDITWHFQEQKHISETEAEQYLCSRFSILTMLAGKTLLTERSCGDDTQKLHL